MSKENFRIGTRQIGAGHPTYIIAELSANHAQNFDNAVKLIHLAKASGADAIKIQTYTADTMTIQSEKPEFKVGKGTLWEGRTFYDLYKEAYTPWEWQPKLKKIANDLGLDLFSTPFDATAVDFLEKMDVPVHKVASFENVDLPLLRTIAKTGKPVIMSTGMANLSELSEAVETLQSSGCRQLALLKCTSAYPSDPQEMNLKTIPHLARAFDVVVGLSDHTLGIAVPVAAVTLGASIIEKHFTDSRSNPGPDSAFSLEPSEFRAMVDSVRIAEKALGRVYYGVSPSESKSRNFRRTLWVVEDVKAGETFTSKNVRAIRPGQGLHTRHLEDILGRQAVRPIERGTALRWDLVGSKEGE